MEPFLIDLAHATRAAFEAVGILAIIIGAIWAAIQAVIDRSRTGQWDVRCFRSRLGRSILLGLEFLVAGDIINTVALEPSLESVAILGAVVVIRTFLSWSLEVEIEGRWPWQSKPSVSDNKASG
jgi:uncharacterized membrane protein